MRRILILAVVLMLALVASAQAEQGDDGIPADFYELNDEQTVLTVRLPANATTGYEWSGEISDEKLLKLVQSEYIPDEAEEGMVGVGGTWVATYECAAEAEGAGGRVTLMLRYTQPFAQGSPEPAMGRALDIWMMESGQMDVDGIWKLELVGEVAQ